MLRKVLASCGVSSARVVRGGKTRRVRRAAAPRLNPSRGGVWGGEAPPAKIRGVWGAAPPSQNRKIFENFSKKFEKFSKNFSKNFRTKRERLPNDLRTTSERPLGFRRKSQTSAKISDFGENLGFRRKSRISVKISDFGENLGFRRKSRISSKISDFAQKISGFDDVRTSHSIKILRY